MTISEMRTYTLHTFGGLGAYLGAATFDRFGGYDPVVVVMAASNVLALALSIGLRQPASRSGALPTGGPGRP